MGTKSFSLTTQECFFINKLLEQFQITLENFANFSRIPPNLMPKLSSASFSAVLIAPPASHHHLKLQA
uniref:Ovule protein n=1 Tax=Ascaris lumbricoides TaxID=6252 RepID=A0A0M3HJ57_ASCLU